MIRERSYGSVRVFWLDRTEAVRRLRRAAARLVRERADVEAVYLFGSLAHDRAVPGSDADVLVIVKETDSRWLDRPLELGGWFEDVGMPVELFCYAAEEVDRAAIARTARDTGVVLAAAA